jgi:hypothetical protein
VALAIAVAASRDFEPRHLAAAAGRYAVIGLLALVGGCVFWPWAQEQPLTRPFEAFFMASGFNWGNPSLFMGQAVGGGAVPWYYLPTWLAITVPIVVLAGMAFAAVRVALPTPSRARLAALGLLLFPAVAAMVRHLSLRWHSSHAASWCRWRSGPPDGTSVPLSAAEAVAGAGASPS